MNTVKTEMIKILGCSVVECVYNKGMQCHTKAITVGGPDPLCDTFMSDMYKAGIDTETGGVGACRVKKCIFNDDLECRASGINIGSHAGHADCLTFKKREEPKESTL